MSLTRSAYGWVLPRSDKHFAGYLAKAPKVEGRRMYQPEHIHESLALCPLRRVAVDVGAHVGFWSYYLALAFDSVHAFEPARFMCQCFEQNVRSKNVTLHRIALGNRSGSVEAEIVEQYAAIEFLQSLGASVVHRVVHDFVLAWPGA